MALIAVSEFTFEPMEPANPYDGKAFAVVQSGKMLDISPDLDEALYRAFLEWKNQNFHALQRMRLGAYKVKLTISQRG